MHGCYLGGVFASIENGLSAGLIALVVSLQPVLTSTLANRWLGERVLPRQWIGLLLGIAGVYLIVHEKMATGETTPLGLGCSPRSRSLASPSARSTRSASAAASTGGRL